MNEQYVNVNASASVSSSSSLSSRDTTEDDQTIARILGEVEEEENNLNNNGGKQLGKRLSHLDSIPVMIIIISIYRSYLL